MKGISPMIATILLIAFTVAIGGIISVWMTGFSRTTTGGVEATATNQTKCAGAYIKIDRVSNTSQKIIYSNPTNQQLTSINLTANDGTYLPLSSTTLAIGGAGYANWTTGTNTSVLATALCLQTVPVYGSCKSGDSCWIS